MAISLLNAQKYISADWTPDLPFCKLVLLEILELYSSGCGPWLQAVWRTAEDREGIRDDMRSIRGSSEKAGPTVHPTAYFFGIRPGCPTNNHLYPTNGVLNIPNLTAGCTCHFAPASVACVPAGKGGVGSTAVCGWESVAASCADSAQGRLVVSGILRKTAIW